MLEWSEHASQIDQSVNWTRPTADGGMLECRYVRRNDDYFIAYISSHSGCRHACRFCHLTQTGQTMFTEASAWDISNQYMKVLGHYDRQGRPAGRVNINFMARGEPLSNRELLGHFDHLHALMGREAERRSMDYRLNLSTIFPHDAADLDLNKVVGTKKAALYWSLYSLDPKFRKRWLPRALAPELTTEKLRAWQGESGGKVVVHWALIAGENDQDEEFDRIAEFLRKEGIDARLNLVRYNPYNEKSGSEADETRYAAALERIGGKLSMPGSKVVSRVGFDVKASCGMFMEA